MDELLLLIWMSPNQEIRYGHPGLDNKIVNEALNKDYISYDCRRSMIYKYLLTDYGRSYLAKRIATLLIVNNNP